MSMAAGSACARQLGPLLERYLLDSYNAGRIFLVTGKNSYRVSGAQAALAALLGTRHVTHFTDFSPNPTLEEVEAGARLFCNEAPDLVLAVGGGSALDLGKMINGVASDGGDARALLTGQATLQKAGRPMIAVPTTSGSGAEATHFAAVYVDAKKYSITHESLRPTHAILDATLTQSLSPYLTAATGMDALSQAIESFWSVRATEESRSHSRKSITLCHRALLTATTAPTEAARADMMQGAYLAGQAIDIARTTAPHALSYLLTSNFGITHGHAVALTLGAVLAYNAQATDAGQAQTMRELCDLLECTDGPQAQQQLSSLMTSCGLKTRLREMGVTRDALPGLVAAVNPQRLKNNPRELLPEALGGILESVY